MKEITPSQHELIVDSLASEGVHYLSPAGLEKDILLTELLRHLAKFESPNFKITFGGGTSLIKNHTVINRISEDLDFKVSTYDFARPKLPRSQLKKLHHSIQDFLKLKNYTFEAASPSDSYNVFSFLINYQSKFPIEVSLRPEILLEFTSSRVEPNPILLKIQTVLNMELGLQEPNIRIPCVTLEQTLAEKIVSLLFKVDSILVGKDDRLVRHLSDIHEISQRRYENTSFRHAFDSAVLEDLTRFSSRSLDLRILSIRDQEIFRLFDIPNIEKKYRDYVLQFSNDRAVDFTTAKNSFLRICQTLE